MTSERILSSFLTARQPQSWESTAGSHDASKDELHHFVGLHSTTGDMVRDYLKQHTSPCWQIPGTGISPLHVAVFRNSYHVLSILESLLEDEDLLDVTLQGNDGITVKALRSVLAVQSPVFRREKCSWRFPPPKQSAPLW